MPAFSFSGVAVWLIAIVKVPVRVSLVKKTFEFIVLNIDSTYNAILNKSCYSQMEVVASLYHQKLKFQLKQGIVEIRVSRKMPNTALGNSLRRFSP